MLTLPIEGCIAQVYVSNCELSKHSWTTYLFGSRDFRTTMNKSLPLLLVSIPVWTNRICGEKDCGGLIPLFLLIVILIGMPWHFYRRVRRKKDTSLKAMFQPDTEEDPEQKRLGGKAVEGYKIHRKFRFWDTIPLPWSVESGPVKASDKMQWAKNEICLDSSLLISTGRFTRLGQQIFPAFCLTLKLISD